MNLISRFLSWLFPVKLNQKIWITDERLDRFCKDESRRIRPRNEV